jgi:hypothetical protein
VNNETTPQNLRIKLVGATASGMVTGEASYESVRWQAIPDFATTAPDEVQYLAPARSVVTLAIPVQSGTR